MMKTNKESLKSAMDRRLSFLDEVPSCRAALRVRIAQEEEPVMKKKVSVGFVFAMVLALLSVAALAAGLLSRRAGAVRVADRALEENYGITAEMQTFFGREEEELPDGGVRITYAGVEGMEYVLGTYTATVRDGKAEVAWSRDGQDVSGGYAAEAWGAEQLKQMLLDSRQAESKQAYIDRARAIALSRNALQEEEDEPSSAADPQYFEKREAEKTAAMNARKIPEEQMIKTGMDFIISNYKLNEEQAARLELYTNSFGNNWEATEAGTDYTPKDCGNTWYEMVNGKPCFQVEFLLYQPVTDEMLERGEDPGREKMDGFYNVFVNVETGEIEEFEYNSALAGLG